jgi:hypothetical protein
MTNEPSRRGFLKALIAVPVAAVVPTPAPPVPALHAGAILKAGLVRSGLPSVTWRRINEGIPPARVRYTQEMINK